MTYKALCLDCDGTIIDSEPLHYQSWAAALADHSIELSFEVFAKDWIGIPAPTSAEYMVKTHQLSVSVDQLLQAKAQHLDELCQSQPQPLIADIKPIIETFANAGIAMAVVSGGCKQHVTQALADHNLSRYFQVIVTGDDVVNNKPAPDGYLAAASALGVAPARLCTVEDSQNGILAAKRAGLHCLAIQHSHMEEQKLLQADAVFQNHQQVLQQLTSLYRL